MGLHDIDKNDAQRRQPLPNSPDNVSNRMAHNTNSNTYRATGSEVTQRMGFKNGLILTWDSDDNISSVYGYVPEVSTVPVLIIAKEGLDVFTDVLGIDAPLV